MDHRNLRVTEDPGVCMESACSGLQLSAHFRAMGFSQFFHVNAFPLTRSSFVLVEGGGQGETCTKWFPQSFTTMDAHFLGCFDVASAPPRFKKVEVRHDDPNSASTGLRWSHWIWPPPPLPSAWRLPNKTVLLLPFLGGCPVQQSKTEFLQKKGARKKKYTLNRTHDNKNAMNAPMVLVVDLRGHYKSRRHFADDACSHIQMSRSITFSMRKQKCNPCSRT